MQIYWSVNPLNQFLFRNGAHLPERLDLWLMLESQVWKDIYQRRPKGNLQKKIEKENLDLMTFEGLVDYVR
jgi:hypothetical protein